MAMLLDFDFEVLTAKVWLPSVAVLARWLPVTSREREAGASITSMLPRV